VTVLTNRWKRFGRASAGVFVAMTGMSALAAEPASEAAQRWPTWNEGDTAVYQIVVHETRETADVRLGKPVELDLRRAVTLSVRAGEIDADGLRLIRCTFDRIQLAGRNGDQPIWYDSYVNAPGGGNPLADLLGVIVGRTFEIRATPDGRFVEVRHIDDMWGGADLFIPPAAGLSVQMLFRDLSMHQLLTEALAPPLPRDLSRRGATCEASIAGDVPMVTPLAWDATFEVVGPQEVDRQPCVYLRGTGAVRVNRHPDDPTDAGLLSTVRSGTQQAHLYVDPKTGRVIRQGIVRDLTLDVQLKPPAGGETPSATITQRRTIMVMRAYPRSHK
jgi:hypothetical protein